MNLEEESSRQADNLVKRSSELYNISYIGCKVKRSHKADIEMNDRRVFHGNRAIVLTRSSNGHGLVMKMMNEVGNDYVQIDSGRKLA